MPVDTKALMSLVRVEHLPLLTELRRVLLEELAPLSDKTRDLRENARWEALWWASKVVQSMQSAAQHRALAGE